MKFERAKAPHVSRSLKMDFIKKDDSILESFENAPCFSRLTYSKIDKQLAKVKLYFSKESVYYPEKQVQEWCSFLKKIDFHSTLEITSDYYVFLVELKNFKSKIHFCSTLCSIRFIYEDGVDVLPEKVSMLKEKHPKYDNLQLIQAAHKHFGMYANTNHAFCGYGEISNFTVDEFKCAIQEDLYTAGSISMSSFWNKSNHTVITATKK